MSEPVKGVVVAHSSLAAGLVAAVQRIAGVDDSVLQAVSNEGLGPEGIVAAVQAAAGDGPAIVFTDLPSGSCAFAARKLTRSRANTGIVCGVNLPILLEFVFRREAEVAGIVEHLVEKGRAGILGACSEEAAHADRAAAG